MALTTACPAHGAQEVCLCTSVAWYEETRAWRHIRRAPKEVSRAGRGAHAVFGVAADRDGCGGRGDGGVARPEQHGVERKGAQGERGDLNASDARPVVVKCIPWSDTCASTVRAQVETLQKADSDAQRVAIICAAAPRPSSAPVDTAVHAVQAASAFSLCTGEKGNEIENCKQDPTGRDLLPEAPSPVIAVPAIVAVRDAYAQGDVVAVGGSAWTTASVRLEVVADDARVHVRAQRRDGLDPLGG